MGRYYSWTVPEGIVMAYYETRQKGGKTTNGRVVNDKFGVRANMVGRQLSRVEEDCISQKRVTAGHLPPGIHQHNQQFNILSP